MNATTASLIGTGIGALAGLAGGWLNGRQQSKLEREKWTRSRHDTIEKDTRLALADLTKKLAAGIHAISWLTWKAKHEPDRLSETDLSEYDVTTKSLFPDIVGSRVVLAALSKETHDQVSPLVEQLYAFDARISDAARLYRSSATDGVKALAECYKDSLQFAKELLDEVTKIGIPEMVALQKGRT